MGGTEFNEGSGVYWSTTNSATGASALSYIPERVWNDTEPGFGLAAGGGGTSLFYPKPVWQTGPGVPSNSYRNVPDISLASSPDHDGYYVFTGNKLQIYGGTSFAAPTMAGIVTLLNQYPVSYTHLDVYKRQHGGVLMQVQLSIFGLALLCGMAWLRRGTGFRARPAGSL